MNNIPPYDISEEELSLIDAYLQDRLDATQQQSFEARMQTDVQFTWKVEEIRNVMTGIAEASLEKKLHVFHEAMVQQENPGKIVPFKKSSIYGWWWAAAAILVLLTASWFFWPKGNADMRLYQAYFVPDIGLPVAMGSPDSSSYQFYDGMVSYKEEDYKTAIRKWKTLAERSGYTDTLHYYIAMCWLNQHELVKAQKILSPLAEADRGAFQEDARWYLALIHLKNGDRSKAKAWLIKLPNREEAQKLLAEIEP